MKEKDSRKNSLLERADKLLVNAHSRLADYWTKKTERPLEDLCADSSSLASLLLGTAAIFENSFAKYLFGIASLGAFYNTIFNKENIFSDLEYRLEHQIYSSAHVIFSCAFLATATNLSLEMYKRGIEQLNFDEFSSPLLFAGCGAFLSSIYFSRGLE